MKRCLTASAEPTRDRRAKAKAFAARHACTSIDFRALEEDYLREMAEARREMLEEATKIIEDRLSINNHIVEPVARTIYEHWWRGIEGFAGDPYYGSNAELWRKWLPAARAVIAGLGKKEYEK